MITIAKILPLHETATFADLSTKTGLDEVNLTRLLRHAMTNRVFKEVEPGVVAHTARSRVLAENVMMDHWIGLCTEEILPVSQPRVIRCALIIFPSCDQQTLLQQLTFVTGSGENSPST